MHPSCDISHIVSIMKLKIKMKGKDAGHTMLYCYIECGDDSYSTVDTSYCQDNIHANTVCPCQYCKVPDRKMWMDT